MRACGGCHGKRDMSDCSLSRSRNTEKCSKNLTQQTISGLSALSCSFQNYLKYNKHNSLHVVRKYARVKDIIVPVRYIDSHSFPRASFSEKLFTSWNRLMYADK